MTLTDALVEMEDGGCVHDIGQLTPDAKRMLERLTKKGFIIKTREHWNTYGIGPLKTTYRLP